MREYEILETDGLGGNRLLCSMSNVLRSTTANGECLRSATEANTTR